MPATVANALNIFISYRNTAFGKTVARQLFDGLKERGYNPYWDKDFIEAGELWDQQIYHAVLDSDVLIVLLDDHLLEKPEWIQREVDTAHAAQIQILPYLLESVDPAKLLERLNMPRTQYLLYDTTPDFARLDDRLMTLAKQTQDAQTRRIQALEDKWKSRQPIKDRARNELSVERFKLPEHRQHPARIHIASGAIHQLPGVEVIVNSENDHFQMSRFHETFTVSCSLRQAGSLIHEASGAVLEDTVQWELDAYVNEVIKARPVRLGYVVPTSAGHPESALRTINGTRYIFHAVTVTVTPQFRQRSMIPIETDDGIRKCTVNVLNLVAQVNRKHGIIAPESLVMSGGRKPFDEQLAASRQYTDIRSIIMPFFGAGYGGRRVDEVIPPMLHGIREFLSDNPDTSLQDIYLCAYFQQEIATLRNQMREVFDPA